MEMILSAPLKSQYLALCHHHPVSLINKAVTYSQYRSLQDLGTVQSDQLKKYTLLHLIKY